MTSFRYLFLLLVVVCAAACATRQNEAGSDTVDRAFEQHSSNVSVNGEGTVVRVLRDDTDGSPHQRFILRIASGQTVLIDHNIEVAPRIEEIKAGDTVRFAGQYVWNEQGGLIHWTHHDPAGRHEGGWLKYNGRTYQ